MPSIHFTGTYYNGFDGPTQLVLAHPGVYDVSADKAAQLTQDFPHEFAPVIEAEVVAEQPATAASGDESAKQVDAATPTDKTPAKGK